MSNYTQRITELTNQAELIQEEILLLQRLQDIESQRTGTPAVTVRPTTTAKNVQNRKPAATTGDAPKRRGRPLGSKNGPKVAQDKGDGKRLDLPTLLETIGSQLGKPTKLDDIVVAVREAGYSSKAKNFSNMVYQAMLKLVHQGIFTKNEDRSYEFSRKVA